MRHRSWLALCGAAAFACHVAACGLFDDPDASDRTSTERDDTTPPAPTAETPPEPPKPPQVTVWKRGSLAPLFGLLPRAEYGRLRIEGVTFQDSDYAAQGAATSAGAKLAEIGSQIGTERGGAATRIVAEADRDRASSIPFRGNPSDVKVLRVGPLTKLYVPLGGDVMTPGNEVAVVTSDASNSFATPAVTRTRVRVGVRPQRVALHPGGLVFVCNQYSNFVSIIDPATDEVLTADNTPIEIKTEHYCSDLAFVPKNRKQPDPDRQYLYVANRWRHSVLKYSADIVRDPVTRRVVAVKQSLEADPKPAHRPIVEILGAGANPNRLSASDAQDALFVANDKGGEIARIDVATDKVTKRIAVNAPTVEVASVRDLVFIPTTTRDRGLLARTDAVPAAAALPPVRTTGIDGQSHVAHPGAMFDETRSYNFEDLRNGLFQIDTQLEDVGPIYYTDDVSAEPTFVPEQKVLAGALPGGVARNAAGDRLYLAMGGSRLVQELRIENASRPYAIRATGRTFATRERPFALALEGDRLFVASWGGETVEVFDVATGARLAEVDLGYALPRYPATTIERGEYFFYDASWSNNGRKACATCHVDELDTDGIGYANGATAPTAYHQVKPNHNLLTTDGYFWNGAFRNGSYASLAFAAQTRTNCELIQFGLVEGPASAPQARIGDPNNAFRIEAQDPQCRPQVAGPSRLTNEAAIATVVAAEKQIANARILQTTGLDRLALSRAIDFYSVAELRLPPNPLAHVAAAELLDPKELASIAQGKRLFETAGCAGCHDPRSTRHPFSDGLNHGPGATWPSRFVAEYRDDPRLRAILPDGIPQAMLDATAGPGSSRTVNLHTPLDDFIPLCFTASSCLDFQDPLAVKADRGEETRRLELLVRINLADPQRQVVPGNLSGQARVNTPSLRGVWTQANLLHHGLARTVAEAILAPGHPALGAREHGLAVDSVGFDPHGATSKLRKEEVDAIVRYVESIE